VYIGTFYAIFIAVDGEYLHKLYIAENTTSSFFMFSCMAESKNAAAIYKIVAVTDSCRLVHNSDYSVKIDHCTIYRKQKPFVKQLLFNAVLLRYILHSDQISNRQTSSRSWYTSNRQMMPLTLKKQMTMNAATDKKRRRSYITICSCNTEHGNDCELHTTYQNTLIVNCHS